MPLAMQRITIGAHLGRKASTQSTLRVICRHATDASGLRQGPAALRVSDTPSAPPRHWEDGAYVYELSYAGEDMHMWAVNALPASFASADEAANLLCPSSYDGTDASTTLDGHDDDCSHMWRPSRMGVAESVTETFSARSSSSSSSISHDTHTPAADDCSSTSCGDDLSGIWESGAALSFEDDAAELWGSGEAHEAEAGTLAANTSSSILLAPPAASSPTDNSVTSLGDANSVPRSVATSTIDDSVPHELRHVARAVRILAAHASAASLSSATRSCETDDERDDQPILQATRFNEDLAVLEPASVATAVAILCSAQACRALEDIIEECELPVSTAASAMLEASGMPHGSAYSTIAGRGTAAQALLRCLPSGAKMPSAANVLLPRNRTTLTQHTSVDDEGTAAWDAADLRAMLETDPAAMQELAAFLCRLKQEEHAEQQQHLSAMS